MPGETDAYRTPICRLQSLSTYGRLIQGMGKPPRDISQSLRQLEPLMCRRFDHECELLEAPGRSIEDIDLKNGKFAEGKG